MYNANMTNFIFGNRDQARHGYYFFPIAINTVIRWPIGYPNTELTIAPAALKSIVNIESTKISVSLKIKIASQK